MSGAEREGLKGLQLRIKASEIVRVLFHKPDPSLGIDGCGHDSAAPIGRLPGRDASCVWIETSQKIARHFSYPDAALGVLCWLHWTSVWRQVIEVGVPNMYGDNRRGFWRRTRSAVYCPTSGL